MSLKRISELPNAVEYYDSVGKTLNLSDFILESSFTKDGGLTYGSGYLTGTQLKDIFLSALYSGSTYVVDGKDIILSGGTNILGWENGDDSTLSALFNNIVLSSSSNTTIGSSRTTNILGNPVVINENLSVYKDSTQTDMSVSFTNKENVIFAKPVDITLSSLQANPNRAVTCGMLNDTMRMASELIHNLDRGNGVDVSDVPTVTWYSLTINLSGSNGSVRYVNLYSAGSTVQITDTNKTYDYTSGTYLRASAIITNTLSCRFIGWSLDGKTIYSTNDYYDIIMNGNKTMYAVFADRKDDPQISVTSCLVDTDSGVISFQTDPTGVTITPQVFAVPEEKERTYTFSMAGYQTTSRSIKWVEETKKTDQRKVELSKIQSKWDAEMKMSVYCSLYGGKASGLVYNESTKTCSFNFYVVKFQGWRVEMEN